MGQNRLIEVNTEITKDRKVNKQEKKLSKVSKWVTRVRIGQSRSKEVTRGQRSSKYWSTKGQELNKQVKTSQKSTNKSTQVRTSQSRSKQRCGVLIIIGQGRSKHSSNKGQELNKQVNTCVKSQQTSHNRSKQRSGVLTNEMMAANSRIFTSRSSNCSKISCRSVLPSSAGSSAGGRRKEEVREEHTPVLVSS